jgi:hypothetical protein
LLHKNSKRHPLALQAGDVRGGGCWGKTGMSAADARDDAMNGSAHLEAEQE